MCVSLALQSTGCLLSLLAAEPKPAWPLCQAKQVALLSRQPFPPPHHHTELLLSLGRPV